jgi:DNA-directed RNA polymerase specialized sigma subunit
MARKRNYLNNRDLLEEIVLSKEKDELTPKALEFLMLLADKCSNRLTYRNPEDKQDCIAYAYMDLYRYWRNFNPEKSTNAFAYFTEIAKRGFAKGWNKLHPKKYHGTVSINGGADSEGIYTI